jgi:hypothetical protein
MLQKCHMFTVQCLILPFGVISFVCKVKFEYCYMGDKRNENLISVDGIDYRIAKHTSFSTRWFSHKFCGPRLQYDI